MEWVNAIVAAFGVGVTAIVAWVSSRTTRARRRADEAQAAQRILDASRAEGGAFVGSPDEARLAHAVRFATFEFTRLMLNDGPRWWTILPVLIYGVGIGVLGLVVPDSAPVIIPLAIIVVGTSIVMIVVKGSRSRRLRAAGVPVPSTRELIERERQEWADAIASRRIARARQVVLRGRRQRT